MPMSQHAIDQNREKIRNAFSGKYSNGNTWSIEDVTTAANAVGYPLRKKASLEDTTFRIALTLYVCGFKCWGTDLDPNDMQALLELIESCKRK